MRILIIEDEVTLREPLAEALREDGYAVDGCGDGDEGLHKAQMYDYNLILLDLNLPTLDGFDLIDRLRRDKNVPVLMLTARDSLEDRVRGLDLGADDYMTKPFELPELRARVRALIRRSSGHGKSTLRSGAVTLDSALRQVFKSGDEIELTAREYAMVELMLLRAGAIVTRSELYEQLFEEEESTLSNLLDVHVYNVRQKLGKDFIKTRRGHGYYVDKDVERPPSSD